MNDSNDKTNPLESAVSDPKQTLLEKAEKHLKNLPTIQPATLDPIETERLIHKLQLHQIELEMQNEQLRENQRNLEISRERFSSLYDFAPIGLLTISDKGLILDVNLTAARLLGVPKSALSNHRLTDFILPEDQDIYYQHQRSFLATGEPQICEMRLIHSDNQPLWARLEAAAVQDEGGTLAYHAVLSDITDRKLAEEALQQSQTLYHDLVETSQDLIWQCDARGKYIYLNPAWEHVFGYKVEEMLGKSFAEFQTPEYAERDLNEFARLLQGNTVKGLETTHIGIDGREIHLVFNAKLIIDEKGNSQGTCGTAYDITDRKQIENELRESEKKFRHTFGSSPDAIIITRLNDGVWIDVNEGFTRATGFTRDDAIGKTALEFNIWNDSADREKLFREVKEKGFSENLETQFRKKDGSLITGLISARLISLAGVAHILSITRDITERKQLQQEQLKNEKLESLGTLAGGLAHDFNNILSAIMGNISFATIFVNEDHKSYKPLIQAERASKRASELVQQLLTFARGGEPIKKVASPYYLVKEAVSLALSGSNVNGTIHISDSIHGFDVDVGQISQVFHNIIINAMHAMPGGGTLIVSACNEDVSQNNVFSLPPGPYVRLMFSDHGCGISEENMKKIFEPYFTLKATGRGLGLASARSIINRHGGYINVSSVVGKGTTVTVYLPSIDRVHTEDQKESTTKVSSGHNAGSILVMDDDPLIRDIASKMLTHFGYEVTTCINGEEAIKLYKTSIQSERPFQMCIMDLTIPGGLGGKEAAEQILSVFPKACLVVSSGYSNDPVMSNYKKYGFSGAIMKPYSISELQKVINSISHPR